MKRFAVALLAGVLAIAGLCAWSGAACQEKLLELEGSNYTARATVGGNCRAEHFDLYTRVSLVKKRNWWPDEEMTIVELTDCRQLRIRWLSGNRLLVAYSQPYRFTDYIPTKLDRWQDIQVEYDSFLPPPETLCAMDRQAGEYVFDKGMLLPR